MIKLDLIYDNRYSFIVEEQVLAANISQYHIEQIGDHDERQEVTQRHHHLDGTCDIYAEVETGQEYMVHTPEKVHHVRITAGGVVESLGLHYRSHA